jgi:hypothetical protein
MGKGPASIARFTFLVSLVVLLLNAVLLSQNMTKNNGVSSSYVRIGSDFFSSFRPVEETVSIHQQSHRQTRQEVKDYTDPVGGVSSNATSTTPKGRHSRMIMGIFSSDSYNDATYRNRHRKLLNEIWKDSRTCTVHEFLHMEEQSSRKQCQLLYTFIIGAAKEEDAPTERLEDTPTNPLTLPQVENPMRSDVNNDDVTRLNIR